MSELVKVWQGMICGCCASAYHNADTTGHEYYCEEGSPEPLEELAMELLEIDHRDEYRETVSNAPCAGCGDTRPGLRYPVQAYNV